ncbi:MAG: CAP domain-containing protein [Terriglobia bacterium]
MRLYQKSFVLTCLLIVSILTLTKPAQAEPPASADSNSPTGVTSKRMAALEKQMLEMVNRDRLSPTTFAETNGRAKALKWNENLAAVARAHSRQMVEEHFFSHVSPEGKTPSMRITAAGIHWRAFGENLALNQTIADAQAALMNEPRFQNNHRANILNPVFTEIGIGIVQAPDGSLYITQDFVALPDDSGTTSSAARTRPSVP